MKNSTRPFEKVYVLVANFNTITDGEVLALLAMDAFSEYTFNPTLAKKPTSDTDLIVVLEKCFTHILNDYKPGKHPETVTYITNLPVELEPALKTIIPQKHKIIFNENETNKAMQPFLLNLKRALDNK